MAAFLYIVIASIALVPTNAFALTRVYAKGDGERINPAWTPSRSGADHVDLTAFRGETVSFQIIVDAGEDPLSNITIDPPVFVGPGLRPIGSEELVESFVPVPNRSRDEGDPETSLAWTAAARPSDEGVLGSLPDALFPIDFALCPKGSARSFCPYPLRVEAGSVGAVWIDVTIPDDQPPGKYSSHVLVKNGALVLGSVDVSLETSAIELPYRPVSFFAYYAFDALTERFDDPNSVEIQLWQLLHAHHVDAVTALTSVADAERIQGALSGDWFTRNGHYSGPGRAVAPSVSVIGAYGSLGEPTNESVDLALAIGQKAMAHDGDTFVYAVDEQCASPLAKEWQDALRGREPSLLTGRTCGEDPKHQPTDLIMISAQEFDLNEAERARAHGKKVFVYNGQLPFAGPLMLDAPLPSLTIDGWIAASYDVGRWFFWETSFWNDNNRGGRGARDVVADAETFHNADGDRALLDGLLIYPGKQPHFDAHSLDAEAVLPSMRLKALRRGIEDAGLIALAAEIDPGATSHIAREIVDGAFDEASRDEPARFTLDPNRLARARGELRTIASRRGESTESSVATDRLAAESIASLRKERFSARPRTLVPRLFSSSFELLAAGSLFALAFAFLKIFAPGARREKRKRTP